MTDPRIQERIALEKERDKINISSKYHDRLVEALRETARQNGLYGRTLAAQMDANKSLLDEIEKEAS